MSQKPKVIYKNKRGQLHADRKPAFEHTGFKLWRLNGVKVPEYIDNRSYQAFDLGINQTVGVKLSGKSVEFTHRRADLYWKKKIEEVQSKRDHCKKYSNKWHWYNSKLLKMIRKCFQQLKDFQHWL